jgi:glycosyltransferase involved in cell wall biosynthesis
MSEKFTHLNNEKTNNLKPKISVVTPVYKNDPSPLLARLLSEVSTGNFTDMVELVVVNDGSNDAALSTKITDFIRQFPISAKYYDFAQNNGRSFARNQLIKYSDGEYLLFLDSDMLPDEDDFLGKWLEYTKAAPEIAYGGYTIKQAPITNENRLARALAGKSDCEPATARSARGAQAVATSNLLVRRDIMEKVPFDCGFKGWGWEDTDWALRADEGGFKVAHIDITATHLGLDNDEILLDKLKKAGPNFKYILENHPQMAGVKSAKLAIMLSKLPFLELVASVMRQIALCKKIPDKFRSLAARLWRGIWAAYALR